ncbi:MAG TPA: M48 family metalloprotease [Actinomycetota bacterium]|nr:M48 family metalloprotease [Actinomycetota bacterium]
MAESNRIQDWNPPARPRRLPPAVGLPLIAAAAVAAVVWALLGPVPALLAVGAVGVGFALWWASQGSRMLRRLHARPARDARLMNLVAGLAGKLGRPVPDVFEAGAPPNAFAVPHSKRGAIVVSDSLLESATRTELEAVVAASLVRLDDPSFGWMRWLAVFGAFAAGDGPVTGYDLDVRAAALTRYPPALAASIQKAVPARGPVAPFSFVAGPPWQPPPAARVAELRDL